VLGLVAPASRCRFLLVHREVRPPARRRRHQPMLPAHDRTRAECMLHPSREIQGK
jgi:hypothetical protein